MEISEDMSELCLLIQRRINEKLSGMRNVEDSELLSLIDEEIEEAETDHYLPVSKKLAIRGRLFDGFRRLDILQELIDDRSITEIMVNGPDDIFIEKNGRITRWSKCFSGTEELENMIQQIVSRVNRTVNVSNPIADARLTDGSRVNVVLPPVSLNGPCLTIRKFPDVISMEKLIEYGSLTREAAEYLERLVKAGYNIFISGGTNSGKTTFLNALSAYIPEDERVITIEDSAELRLMHIRNIVRFEARMPNAAGEGAVTIADLIKASLRANPDRIIVGEVRGAEALDMLQAMNTGHDGSISTGHGNSPGDMLSRIETMVLGGANLPLDAVRGQMASAIDIMVHLGRGKNRTRQVMNITEVCEYEKGRIRLNGLFERVDKGKGNTEFRKVGKLENTAKLTAAGFGLQGV